MASTRRRRSLTKSVKFANDEDSGHEDLQLLKPALRIGNFARYGNTIFQIREPKEDSIYCRALEVIAVVFVFLLVYACYFHYEAVHFHVAKGYGHLGYASAQHVVGQRLLTGRGATKNGTEAMRWFKYAADQGHAEASFNLAVGHIHGEKTGLKPGQTVRLLKHAKKHGVEGVDHALNLCARRNCDI
ncbi:uncharacterized protein LOC143446318 [Clavelina lepadiformis]|uniref:uncharacterized protein LOC143446318 n=1 Tax=Clavelina lepadiformis TaxID=159417 RepID=UPI0040422E5D